MAKTVDTNFTKRKLEKWLEGLTKPRKQLDGLPVCPYLKHYRDRIHLAKNNDPERLARHFALSLHDALRSSLCSVWFLDELEQDGKNGRYIKQGFKEERCVLFYDASRRR